MTRKWFLRVMLVDPEPVGLLGIQSFLEKQPDIRIVAVERSVQAAIKSLHLNRNYPDDFPKVVITELLFPTSLGFRVLEKVKELRRQGKSCQALVLTELQSQVFGWKACQNGAAGYITKHEPPESLLAAVRKVAVDKPWFSPELKERLLSLQLGRTALNATDKLSNRQLEVMYLLSRGMSWKEIASHLDLSYRTINSYWQAVQAKFQQHCPLGAPAAAFAARFAQDNWNLPVPSIPP